MPVGIKFSVYASEALFQEIERERGIVPRSTFVEYILEEILLGNKTENNEGEEAGAC